MDGRRKWKQRALAGLQVLAAAVIAGAVLYLLYRYTQYGERFAREAGTSRTSRQPEETDSETPGEEAAGVESEDTDRTGNAETESERLPDTIRVRILTDDFAGEYHDRVEVTSENAFVVKLDGKKIGKRKNYGISASELKEGQTLQIGRKDGARLTVESLKRADGHPRYAGTLLLYREADGLALVNELSLEEYLCGVVASEMPSGYPEEAQKAQAVCARTYACNCIRNAGDSLSDLDDSVNYQVYNNYQATEQSRRAVEATTGEILPLDEIWYYSTSCLSEHREDLDSDEAFREFLAQEPDAGAEYDSPWLRWETETSARDLLRKLADGYGWQAERIDELCVTERAGNGQVQALKIRCGNEEKLIQGEYAVRQFLSAGQMPLLLRDGKEHSGMELLPSAFFWLEIVRKQEADGAQKFAAAKGASGMQEEDGQQEPESQTPAETEEENALPVDRVVIHGGGYGHGIGMSQCGAAAMAEKGLDYRQILEYYYQCGLSG